MFRILPLTLLLLLFSVVTHAQEPKLILPIGHTLGVGSAVFSPDGKRMVTSALDNTAKIWDVETGRLLANLIGHEDTLFTADYSPDGKKIVTSGEDGTAKIWDANSTLLLADLRGHTNKVYAVEFSPDGKKIVTSSQDASVKIWDASTGKLLADLIGHTKAVWFARFSQDGKYIASASEDSTAKIWDAATGKLLIDLKGHQFEVLFVEFSPDGKKVITASGDSTAKIWDAQTGKILRDIRDHNSPVRYAHFSPDGKRFVTAADFGDVKLWNAGTYSLIANINGRPATNAEWVDYDLVRAADFTPDGKKLLTVYFDSTAKIWDANTGNLLVDIKRNLSYVNAVFISRDSKRFSLALIGGNAEIYDITKGTLIADLKGEANFVQSFKYSRDAKRILISNETGPLKLMDAVTGTFITLFSGSLTKNNTRRKVYGAFSPDGKKVITSANEGVTRVWDAGSGTHLWNLPGNLVHYFSDDPEWRKIITLVADSGCKIWNADNGKLLIFIKNDKGRMSSCLISQNGKRIIAYSSQDTTIKTWELETGRLVSQFKFDAKNYAIIRISPSGDKLLTNLPGDSTITLWNTNTGAVLYTINLQENLLAFADFSPDSKKLFVQLQPGINLGSIKILDVETGSLITDVNITHYYSTSIFSPDGKQITYSFNDGSFKTWDFEKKEYTVEYKGHTGDVWWISYSPDKKKLISASHDNTAKIWEVGTGKLLLDLKGHNFWVNSASFSPDGKKIVTISRDNTTKIWDAETGALQYSFISVNDEDYLVLDKYSHYDGTEAARKLLYFTCGTEIIELEQLKDQLWVPNLVERIMNGEPVNAQKLSDLNICNLTPLVDTLGQTASHYRFQITPRMGGLGVSILYVNGIEVKRFNPAELTRQGAAYLLSANKKDLQRFFVSGKENNVTVKALTTRNSISSRSVSIVEKSTEQSKALPNLYAIVVGVSDYKGDELDLKYAAKDAIDMANTINTSAGKLLNTDGKEHVFVYKLHTGPGRDKFPEKNSIRETFSEIAKKAGPNDILLIFFAGHGVMEAVKNQFYFLTADASNATVFGALNTVGISTEELAEWIKPQVMKAQKRILIFDACNSGQAIKEMISLNSTGQNALAARSDDKTKQIKAIEKLNERAGVFILSASASDQRAYEIGKYNQGALTYSLLRAIKEEPDILENRQYLNVSRWFNAAEKTVSELARETGARQQPQQVSTTNFSIGIVDDEVRNKIVLPFEKFLFTRSDFRNNDSRIDNLKLRNIVDQQLENNAEGGMGSSILYSPEYDGVNVYAMSGDYTVTGQQISVTVILTKGGTEIKTKFEVTGLLTEQEDISKKITSQAINWLSKNK